MKSVLDSIGNVASSFIIQAIGLVTSILVARELGPYNKGLYTYLLVLNTTLLPILYFGFNAGSYYYLASKTFTFKDTLFSLALIGLMIGLLTGLSIYTLGAFGILGETGNAIDLKHILLFSFTLPFYSIYFIMNRSLMAISNFKLANLFSIGRALINVFSLLLFVILLKEGFYGALKSFVIVNIVYSIFHFVYVLKLFKPIFRLEKKFIKFSFSYGFKAWLGSISNRANDKLDQLLLGIFSSAELLGAYSVGYNYSKLVDKPINGIFKVLFNRVAENKDLESSKIFLEKVHRAMLIACLPLLFLLLIFAHDLIELMYGEEYIEAIKPTYVMLPGIFLYMVTRRVLQLFLSSKGHPGKSSVVQAIGALAGAVFYFILIPKYNIMGAAWGTTIAFIISTIVAFYFYRKLIKGYKIGLFSLRWSDLRWVYDRLSSVFKKII